jgi:hypothetical protein
VLEKIQWPKMKVLLFIVTIAMMFLFKTEASVIDKDRTDSNVDETYFTIPKESLVKRITGSALHARRRQVKATPVRKPVVNPPGVDGCRGLCHDDDNYMTPAERWQKQYPGKPLPPVYAPRRGRRKIRLN